MTEIVKPFMIIDTITEAEGNTGVWFWAQKTTHATEGTTTHRMRTYLSVEPDEDVDAVIYAFLEPGGWV